MGAYTYKQILSKAKLIKQNVEKEYKIGENTSWAYYIAKEIIKPKSDVKTITVSKAKSTTEGDHISNQIYKKDYLDMAKRFIAYVEKNNQLPNYITVKLSNKTYKVNLKVYTDMFARILVYYSNNNALPSYANVNSKAFTKPTENKNTVFTKWVNKFKFTPKYIDDVCDYILKHFDYQFYYDDEKTNAQVIDSKAGNCTDLLQMLINMAEALGYEWKVIHTKCKVSGTGHVYGMFRKKSINGGNWFVRDIACIADESHYCVWCEVPDKGNKLAENPNWFLENLRR